MLTRYALLFLSAVVLTAFFTFAAKRLAEKLGVLDCPDGVRKQQARPVPLLGGAAIFVVFFALLYFSRAVVTAGNLDNRHWLGLFVGALILMIGGYLDDRYRLSPGRQIIFPVAAALAVIIGGVGIEKISNPFGGFIYFDHWQWPLFTWSEATVYFTVASDIFIFLWLLGMMYTTKLLDGLDGLVAGLSGIGALLIFLFTLTAKYYQPDVGWAALILAGCCAGFLVFNWHPAKIFLGEGGSLLCGFLLGVLAVISGGKIAIALLVMGLPIMDAGWTIIRRLAAGQNPFRFADREHLHFRLLALGLSVPRSVLVFYGLGLFFGLAGLGLQSVGKLLALSLLLLIMLGAIFGFHFLKKQNK